jgi:alkylated DNA repair dioxygenase AlkB
MGWHSDNEKELGFTPTIVSISLGETRRFDIKHRINKSQKLSLHLNSGSLLVMSGQSQANWLHQIPQQLKIEKGRINLTFRELI